MPPRKRTASAAEATEEPQAPEVEQPEIEAPDEPEADAGSPAVDSEGEGGPARSDLQAVEQPCPECVPNGWPDGAFSVGCTHGTWIRDSA